MKTEALLGIVIPAAVSIFIALAAPYLPAAGSTRRIQRLEALQKYRDASPPGSKQRAKFEEFIEDHLGQTVRAEKKQLSHLRASRRWSLFMLWGTIACLLAQLGVLKWGNTWWKGDNGHSVLVFSALGILIIGAFGIMSTGKDPSDPSAADAGDEPATQQGEAGGDVQSAAAELAAGPDGTSPASDDLAKG